MNIPDLAPGFTFARDVHVGGHVWRVICRPTNELLARGSSWMPLGVAGLVLLFTAALVLYLLQNLRNARRLEDTNLALDQQMGQTDEMRRAAEANERRFRALFEGSRDALVVVDPANGRLVSGNQAATELFACRDLEEI